ncbi:unnamed protein product [Larinioides sclopetarius]|uniref:Uncharacterized protein n=1 Tax=Larinioides sclopetarius TaxID=280406 RepID=A0AAV2APJ4_9ARAC
MSIVESSGGSEPDPLSFFDRPKISNHSNLDPEPLYCTCVLNSDACQSNGRSFCINVLDFSWFVKVFILEKNHPTGIFWCFG